MAHGLEERFPFMDNDLVDFAMQIPVEHKLGNLEDEIREMDENIVSKRKIYREYNDGKNVLRKAYDRVYSKNSFGKKKARVLRSRRKLV